MQTYDVQSDFQGPVKARRKTTKYIVVHHAAALYRTHTGIEDVKSVATYHTRKWPGVGIGYHVCLAEQTNGGPIARYNVSDLSLVRAHVAWHNHDAVGVSCLTNFTGVPEQKWIDALVAVLIELKTHYPHARIVGHRDIALGPWESPDGKDWRSACPGPAWNDWKEDLLCRVAAGRSESLVEQPIAPEPLDADPITAHSPILAGPRASIAQMVSYILSRRHGEYTHYDIEKIIIPTYWDVATSVYVDPLGAVAQMIHETGNMTSFWASRPQRNPAGIGVNGEHSQDAQTGDWSYNSQRRRWERGLSFASWKDGVRAQVGRLLAYAVTDDYLADDVGMPLAVRDLRRRQRELVQYALNQRDLPPKMRGSAPTYLQLGKAHNPTGMGWAAPGDQYAEKIADIGRAIQQQG